MNCTKCRHLDARHGECMQLRHKVICGQCLKTYPIAEIWHSCGCKSTHEAGKLAEKNGEYTASPYYPLRKAERKALIQAQNQMDVHQGQLF